MRQILAKASKSREKRPQGPCTIGCCKETRHQDVEERPLKRNDHNGQSEFPVNKGARQKKRGDLCNLSCVRMIL